MIGRLAMWPISSTVQEMISDSFARGMWLSESWTGEVLWSQSWLNNDAVSVGPLVKR